MLICLSNIQIKVFLRYMQRKRIVFFATRYGNMLHGIFVLIFITHLILKRYYYDILDKYSSHVPRL